MKIGKVPENVLKRSVFKQIHTKRPEVVLGAGVGEDCAAVKLAEEHGFPVKRCRILRVGRDETEGFEERVVTDTEKYFRVFQNLLEIYYLKKELRWN